MATSMQDKVRELGDLELAILVCLVARQHCLFSTTLPTTQDLQEELRLACKSIFGLRPVIVECSAATTVEEFSEGVLVKATPAKDHEHTTLREDIDDRPTLAVNFSSLRDAGEGKNRTEPNAMGFLDDRRIADVIIATNLDLASESVQVQALELIRSKRIFTRTAMHTASKDFMVLAIASKAEGRLSHHLNDLFCMSHLHAEEDGLPYLFGELDPEAMPTFSNHDIRDLRLLADETHHTPEIAAYMHNIVVFMRNSRYIQNGVTATATRQLRIIAKTLAPLHGLQFVPPSLVMLAVRKIYPHRLRLATAETEASLQWGSDQEDVRRLLDGFTVEDAIEDVLARVEAPL